MNPGWIDKANGIYIEFAFGILLLFTWYYRAGPGFLDRVLSGLFSG